MIQLVSGSPTQRRNPDLKRGTNNYELEKVFFKYNFE